MAGTAALAHSTIAPLSSDAEDLLRHKLGLGMPGTASKPSAPLVCLPGASQTTLSGSDVQYIIDRLLHAQSQQGVVYLSSQAISCKAAQKLVDPGSSFCLAGNITIRTMMRDDGPSTCLQFEVPHTRARQLMTLRDPKDAANSPYMPMPVAVPFDRSTFTCMLEVEAANHYILHKPSPGMPALN